MPWECEKSGHSGVLIANCHPLKDPDRSTARRPTTETTLAADQAQLVEPPPHYGTLR